ncbi:hypothetical protein GCM10017687_81070 [Streptomyces echinatus]|uniref:proline racemase family protein n=1 Tax=Streptomyces echinatus TaxID=67293 RepID=UPI0031E6FAFF
MSGAILRRRADACDWGVLYIEVSGYLPMCGHGTIAVATVLVETGMVEVVEEPVTTIRLDTPACYVGGRRLTDEPVGERRRARRDDSERSPRSPSPWTGGSPLPRRPHGHT